MKERRRRNDCPTRRLYTSLLARPRPLPLSEIAPSLFLTLCDIAAHAPGVSFLSTLRVRAPFSLSVSPSISLSRPFSPSNPLSRARARSISFLSCASPARYVRACSVAASTRPEDESLVPPFARSLDHRREDVCALGSLARVGTRETHGQEAHRDIRKYRLASFSLSLSLFGHRSHLCRLELWRIDLFVSNGWLAFPRQGEPAPARNIRNRKPDKGAML